MRLAGPPEKKTDSAKKVLDKQCQVMYNSKLMVAVSAATVYER